jgi:Dolichyl-phosphate-mannose-protein mannosyltransferase
VPPLPTGMISGEDPFAFKIRTMVRKPTVLCALLLAACIAASHPRVEMGLNDDWSYIWSARVLSTSNHVQYNGWATAILGWQLYVGALFIKLFGFSFTILRISTLIVAMITTVVIHRLSVRLGLTERNATLATLTVVLSPVFMPLAFSFMSDVPGLLCITLCFYMCVRAAQADSDLKALLWIIFAALVNTVGGTVRQTAWLGILVVIPSVTWYMRGRRGILIGGAASCLVGAVVVSKFMSWFSQQPYSIVDNLVTAPATFTAFILHAGAAAIRVVLGCSLLLVPILIAFLTRYPVRLIKFRKQGLIAISVLIIILVLQVIRGEDFFRITLPIGNIVGPKGILDLPGILGGRPDVLTRPIRVFLTSITFAVLSAYCLCWSNRADLPTCSTAITDSATSRLVSYLFWPFTAAYCILMITRSVVYDRYLIPLVVVASIVSLRFYQNKYAGRPAIPSVLFVVLFAIYGVAGMHDTFEMDRARLSAVEELAKAGIFRKDIRAGLEYDAWTELELTGHVNDERIRLPQGAYHPWNSRLAPQSPCRFPFEYLTPSLTERFLLTYQPLACAKPTEFGPISFRTWLPPHQHQIFIEELH